MLLKKSERPRDARIGRTFFQFAIIASANDGLLSRAHASLFYNFVLHLTYADFFNGIDPLQTLTCWAQGCLVMGQQPHKNDES